MSEVAELIEAVKRELPDLQVSQLTNFGEEPFESGVWKLWLKDNKNVHLHIEVNNGMLWAIYANKEFANKYPINAGKICEFFKCKKGNCNSK